MTTRWLALIGAIVAAVCGHAAAQSDVHTIRFTEGVERHWLGGEIWGNRLHDWRVANGRLECVTGGRPLPMRTAHHLSRRLRPEAGSLRMTVRTGLASDSVSADAATGFLVGVGGTAMDPRAAAIVHQWSGRGAGWFVGLRGDGSLFIEDNEKPRRAAGRTPDGALPRDGWRVRGVSSADGESPGSAAIDGRPRTHWHSAWRQGSSGHPHVIELDLGAPTAFDGLALLPRQRGAATRLARFDLEASPDGVKWTRILAGTTSPGGRLQNFPLKETKARFVRLRSQSSHGRRPGVAIAEIWLTRGARPRTPAATFSGAVTLVVEALPRASNDYLLTVSIEGTGKRTARVIPQGRLAGNVALVSHGGADGETRFWFDDWSVGGAKVAPSDERFGPVVSALYTVHRGELGMTAQLAPVGPGEVTLEVETGRGFVERARAEIVIPGYTAHFRLAGWDSSRDVRYRLAFGGTYFPGVFRKDPVDKKDVVLAAFTGNHNNSHAIGGGARNGTAANDWVAGMWFPHADLTEKVARHDPDLLFFSGDQVYEGKSPTFADRANIELDYLYKWYLWCWAWRDLTRDRPAVCLPDDHDVYQGNVWGEGGRKAARDHDGGYVHPAAFVRMVDRTQTSHLPRPFDPRPIDQGIRSCFTGLTWGRVSFAILEDRKFKSGCNRPEMPPSKTRRPDHFNDPEFDVRRLDRPGLTLLGPRQLAFLESWARDWRGADMKAALSQTIFANLATHHGGGLSYIRADLDSNGWPQSGRNRALAALRKGFAVHVAGDQHLATVAHHGIDGPRDAIWSFCVPSVANFYPRAWFPGHTGRYRVPTREEFTGDRRDGLGNHVSVVAATNPGRHMGHPNRDLHDQMPGYGIVRFHRAERRVTFECWPRKADPRRDAPYDGWPVTVDQRSNDGREPTGWLPTLEVKGAADPIVIVTRNDGTLEYALRIVGHRFEPMVYAEGPFTVEVIESGTGRSKKLRNVKPGRRGGSSTTVSF